MDTDSQILAPDAAPFDELIKRYAPENVIEGEAEQSQVVEHQQRLLSLIEPEEVTRPEVNIARYASMIFTSPYGKGKFAVRQHEWKAMIGEDEVDARIVIRPGRDLKTLTTTSYKVFLALVQIWEAQGRPMHGEIMFSARQLAKMLNWKWGGATAERIKEQIEILYTCTLQWEWSFTKNGEKVDLENGMHLLDEGGGYRPAANRLKKTKFDAIHKVRFNKRILENLLDGATKPIHYFAYISIGNETAANLYTHLDVILAKKSKWERRAYGLIREDLGIDSARYDQKKHRLVFLKKMVAELNLIRFAYGHLKVSVEPTADGKDWKLVASVRRIPEAKIPPPKKLANDTAVIPVIVEDLMEALKSIPGGMREQPSKGFIEALAKWYPKEMLFKTLSVVKADYRGNIKKSAVRVFIAELHVEAHRRNLEWISQCHPSPEKCKYIGRMPLFET